MDRDVSRSQVCDLKTYRTEFWSVKYCNRVAALEIVDKLRDNASRRYDTRLQCSANAVYGSVHGVIQLLLWCVKTKRRRARAKLNKLAMSREVTAPCRPGGATHTTNQLPSALPLPDAYACGDHTALILFSLLPMKPTESFSVLSSQRREDSGVTSHRQPRQCRGPMCPKR